MKPTEFVKPHYQFVGFLLKTLVTDRFKRMARDEVLFKFISSRIDPVLLIDHHLQAEREALDLAELSLLQLVDSTRLSEQLRKSAERIQNGFHRIYGIEVSETYQSEALIELRMQWLDARVQFYRKWLSYAEKTNSPLELANRAFRTLKGFEDHLAPIRISDEKLSEELVRQTKPFYRFLMKKQLDYELQNAQELWEELKVEAFKQPAALH